MMVSVGWDVSLVIVTSAGLFMKPSGLPTPLPWTIAVLMTEVITSGAFIRR